MLTFSCPVEFKVLHHRECRFSEDLHGQVCPWWLFARREENSLGPPGAWRLPCTQGPYGSLRTPPVPSELRAWCCPEPVPFCCLGLGQKKLVRMDWRQERSGLDTGRSPRETCPWPLPATVTSASLPQLPCGSTGQTMACRAPGHSGQRGGVSQGPSLQRLDPDACRQRLGCGHLRSL